MYYEPLVEVFLDKDNEIYCCPVCNNIIDRDLNASKNKK